MTTPTPARPPVTDPQTWRHELAALRAREKAATRELAARAAQRRRPPKREPPAYALTSADGPVRLSGSFGGTSQLIPYPPTWRPDSEWPCGGCTSYTTQFTPTDFLRKYDARFVIITPG